MRISTILAALMAMGIPVLNAQEKPKPPTFSTGTNAVIVPVSVVDKKGKDVVGLTAQDFVVTENGIQQEIADVQRDESGHTDLIILLDISSSMGSSATTGSGYSSTTILDLAKASAKKIIDSLDHGDRVMLVVFFDVAAALSAPNESFFTSNLAMVRQFIDILKPAGKTRLYASVYATLKSLPPLEPKRRRVMVLISDGEDMTSLVTPERTIEEAVTSRVTIHAIELPHHGLGHDQWLRSQKAHDFLVSLTTLTSGTLQSIKRNSELPKASSMISRELSMRYQVTYSSTNDRPDGQWRQIMVYLNGHAKDEWIIRHRLGYYAPMKKK